MAEVGKNLLEFFFIQSAVNQFGSGNDTQCNIRLPDLFEGIDNRRVVLVKFDQNVRIAKH